MVYLVFFFFFQAEDGIRDGRVTGVQTCALPIYLTPGELGVPTPGGTCYDPWDCLVKGFEIPSSVVDLPGKIAKGAATVIAPFNSTLLIVLGIVVALAVIRVGPSR